MKSLESNVFLHLFNIHVYKPHWNTLSRYTKCVYASLLREQHSLNFFLKEKMEKKSWESC